MQRPFFVLIALSACTTVSSPDLRTSGMSARLSVSALQSGSVEATAKLFPGEIDSLTTVEIKGSDRLSAQVGSNERQMTKIDILNNIQYSASFAAENNEGAEFVFKFERTIDGGAPRSACQLPKGFEITQPTDQPMTARYSRSLDDIVVAYRESNTTDRIRYKVSGSCIEEKEYPLDSGDQGTFTIPKTNLVPLTADKKNETCTVTLAVLRYRIGAVDTGFGKGGHIECMQDRRVQFDSIP